MGPGIDEVLKLNPSTNEKSIRTHSEEGNTSASEEDTDETQNAESRPVQSASEEDTEGLKNTVSRPVEVKTSDSAESKDTDELKIAVSRPAVAKLSDSEESKDSSSSMSNRLNPPEFCADASGYAEYKKRLLRWSRITTISKRQQAEVVLYHLEDHPSGIQEKIDTALSDKIQDKENGLSELIKYLDAIYEEDDMTTAWTSYKRFVRLAKRNSQPVSEFIAEFDKEYKKARECGCVFSDTVLSFFLLESCRLSEVDEKFVLTGIDFKVGKESANMLDQVKSSLRKFQSREKMSTDPRFENKLKVDESLLTAVQQVMISEGWKAPEGGGRGRRRSYSESDTGGMPRNSNGYQGKKNPLGSNGKPLRCFDCQSEYHMRDKCDKKDDVKEEESEENKEEDKKDRYKKEKKGLKDKKGVSSATPTMLSALLKKNRNREFTMVSKCSERKLGELILAPHSEQELACLVEEVGVRGVLDCGCSKSVAGVKWLINYIDKLDEEVVSSLRVEESMSVYQFGGGETRTSKGCIKLPSVIGDKKVNIQVEVVDAEIPLLIGSNSMQAAKALLDFGNMEATFFDEEISMIKVGSGLLCIDLITKNLRCNINEVTEKEEAVEEAIIVGEPIDKKTSKKLQQIFGHTPTDKLLKLLQKTANKEFIKAEALEVLKKSIESNDHTGGETMQNKNDENPNKVKCTGTARTVATNEEEFWNDEVLVKDIKNENVDNQGVNPDTGSNLKSGQGEDPLNDETKTEVTSIVQNRGWLDKNVKLDLECDGLVASGQQVLADCLTPKGVSFDKLKRGRP